MSDDAITTTSDDGEDFGYYDGQVHRWLSKYRKLVSYRDHLRAISASQLEDATGVKAVRYDFDKIRASVARDVLEEAAVRHMEMSELYDRLAEDASLKAKAISTAILAVSDLDSRHALLGHYVEGKTWEKLCLDEGFECSYSTMMRRRKRGLMEIYDRDLMPVSERDPRYSAV